jgi:hypothetical protein
MVRLTTIGRLALTAVASVFHSGALAADPHWIRARLGPFESISDDGRKPAIQALSQFVQFSFALGTAMGKPDLKLDPPVRVIVFKTRQELEAQCGAGLRVGRDRTMACTTAEGQLPPVLLRELTKTLLENNFANMPPGVEKGLETFFSTVQSSAVHVTWGTPPPVAERTREWALIHKIITQTDYSGKAKVYLHNLASGMEKSGASRNAFAEEGPKFDAEVDQYYAAGVFNSSQAPSRPLNPDRDFNTSALTSDEGELMRADLLTPQSEAAYQALVKAGKHVAEDNEGLALLAIRRGDAPASKTFINEARKAGTKNFVALTAAAELDKDPVDSIDMLKEALTLDPRYAKAHWVLGERITEPARRAPEWKQAVDLAPRNSEWWADYARLCLELKQYAEAGRAWMGAAQSAPTPLLREQYLSARASIDEQRLAEQDSVRRKELEAKALEIDRLKAEARKELAGLEARANKNPLSKEEAAKTVDWDDADKEETISGTLTRVDCAGKQLRLNIRDDGGAAHVLTVRDPSHLFVDNGTQGGTATLACGVQKPRHVNATYRATRGGKGTAGEASGLEFR